MTSSQFINFIDQTGDIFSFNNLENIRSVYHYSIPNTKLAYPEPFVASASFMHSDLWFVHILIYQYWLWFVFIFIIVFFFITFLATIRWCNMRIRPRRETRGVSRSKCGDLITAIVPVSWATSIIVNESTDAIDYYDGFGTTELVVGIRAYQWGWEYYYPKDIDLSYNIKPNYSVFLGNSLKYNRTTDTNLHANNVWKFYQNKNFDQIITPAHLLVIPSDNNRILNFLNFNDIGSNALYESNAFKRIRMFSKNYTASLFTFLPNSYASKYKQISSYYINRSAYEDSSLYGLRRQHSYLNKLSLLNSNTTFLDVNSINKLLFLNYQNNAKFESTVSNNANSFFFFNKTADFNNNFQSAFVSNVFKTYFTNLNATSANNFFLYTNLTSLINNDSDEKKINNALFAVFNDRYFDENLFFLKENNNQITNINSDIFVNIDNVPTLFFFANTNKSYKSHLLFAPNQSISMVNRNMRTFLNSIHSLSNLNYSTDLNEVSSDLRNSNSRAFLNNFYFYKKLNSVQLSPLTSSKILSNRLNPDYPYSPINSSNANINSLNFDSHKFTFVENTPTVLQGKDELIPSFIPSIYWNFFWLNSSAEWRFSNIKTFNSATTSFYLPIFAFYYDYDFRNWQSLELLEDCFWESTYSIYNHDEYASLAKDFYSKEYADKFINYFNKFNRNISITKNQIVSNSYIKDCTRDSFYSNFFFLEDSSVNPSTLKFNTFSIFPTNLAFNSLDENYENFKNVNHLFNLNGKFFLNNSFFRTFNSHFFVLDSFRSDFDEFSWYIEENDENFVQKLKVNSDLNSVITSNDASLIDYSARLNDKNSRFTNNVNLRNTAKNSIVTYNAIQKIFKTRFDENRSHTKLNDFASFYNKQAFISSDRTSYETMLKKNKEKFYTVNFYKNDFKMFFNSFYDISSSLNFYFFDFPFLLAMKSDSSRYLWFDWFSKWGYYEVQPSSSSRYAIHGMPYFSKNFEFATSNNEILVETENYLTRLAKARRNYLPNWAYSPYFYAKNNVWYKNKAVFDSLTNDSGDISNTLFVLKDSNWYWSSPSNSLSKSKSFFPSNSNIASFSRAPSSSQNSISSYYYNISSLVDILTKREYLYRQLLISQNKIIALPSHLTNSPTNPILKEIKSSLNFLDSNVFEKEYSKESYFYSLIFFNKTFDKFLSYLPLNSYTDYFFNLLLSHTRRDVFTENVELYKNQYRPMRKGITNMIRLHATGAMALPIEIRLQVLASSKDVIHSWAIPSAGIKIDCVPGYSSHRVMIFLVSGIFWGQCMEICGRYHHWMPIVVYFMKRDLFFLWCTHFIFLSGSNNAWSINDKQYSDYVRLASFDKNGWISEVINR